MDKSIRCEMKVGFNKFEFKDNMETDFGLKEWPHKWPKGEISYRLNNKTEDIEDQCHQDRALTVALRAWQLRISDLRFRKERNPDAHVDFNVSFKPKENFSGNGTLAHAWYPGQGDVSGDCEINDNWHWVTSVKHATLAKPPLVPILIHEFGHSLGLTHDTRNMESIMYPSFDLGKKKNKLSKVDIARMQQRYGARTIPQRLIDYFHRRRDMAWDFR